MGLPVYTVVVDRDNEDLIEIARTGSNEVDRRTAAGLYTIRGTYMPNGKCYGSRVYRKQAKQSSSSDDYVWEVNMYRWDGDVRSERGWWIGQRVAGEMICAFNPAATHDPPLVGWRVPHDSERPRYDLRLVRGCFDTQPGA